jgi:hypothetical protein
MEPDHPDVLAIVRRSMIARIATLSRNGRPSVNPLYFVPVGGEIWLGTADWTLAARNVRADPRVSVLFGGEQSDGASRLVRLQGRAHVVTDGQAQRSYALRVARKYVLTRGGIRNLITHAGLLGLRRRYYAQSRAKGRPCVIRVAPDRAQILTQVNRWSPRGPW